jgi:hypothetical protein
MDSVEQKLEEHYDTLMNRLQPGPLPKIIIAIWTDKEAFDKAQNYRHPGATGYVNGKEEVRVLHVGRNTGIIAVHELVHVITLFMSPNFGNNPRWLWEAVAVYEAKQFISPSSLPYMVSGDYPTLTILSNEQGTTQRIYQVGYTISEFIVKKWGYEGLRSLIKANGDIKKTFGIDNSSFEQQWYGFVKTTYL